GPPVRILDHQVTVERQRGVLEQRLDDGQAEGEVRHEVVVHDIHVQPVRGGGDRSGLIGEPGKVRGQDARRDLNSHSKAECRVPGCGSAMRGENVVWRGYSSILSSIGIDLEVAYAFGPAQRPARTSAQAAGEGRGGGGDPAGG